MEGGAQGCRMSLSTRSEEGGGTARRRSWENTHASQRRPRRFRREVMAERTSRVRHWQKGTLAEKKSATTS